MVKVVRKPQVLTISPKNEVVFKGDPSESNTTKVHLFNPSPDKVAFKILTNVPHLLFVRPTCDVIPPEGSCTVNVMSQAASEKDAESFINHKLLIQSILMPSPCDEAADKLIATNANTEDVMETKLSCAFHVSYTSEMSLPSEGEEERVTHKAVGGESKSQNGFNYYAVIAAVLVGFLAYLIYCLNFRSDDAMDVVSDATKDLEEELLNPRDEIVFEEE